MVARSVSSAGWWLVLGGACLACQGEDISAGRVGNAINASRCYGVGCDAAVTSGALPNPPHRACDGVPALTLTEELRVPVPINTLRGIAPAPDGSIWALEYDYQPDAGSVWLERYGADGTLLAATGKLAMGSTAQVHFTVDAASRAWFIAYLRAGGPTADDDYTESTIMRGFEPDGSSVRPTQLFGDIAASWIAPGPDGSLVIAGAGERDKARGSLIRLEADGQLAWTQTALTTSGGAGVGITGLAVHADGTAAVLLERARGSNDSSFALSRFDASGHLVADAVIRTPFTAGFGLALAADAQTNLVVAGPRGINNALVQFFPSDGGDGWAYEFFSSPDQAIGIDPATGDVFTNAGGGLAVISAGGSSCAVTPVPRAPGALEASYSSLIVVGDSLYFAEESGEFGRFRIGR